MSRTSPIVLRSGYIFNNWKSHWFSDKNYTQLLTEDLRIRYYINNVYYYLKLPSSDLKIRRRQNRINIMYQNLFLPEFIRTDKLNPYKFKFFRFGISNFKGLSNIFIPINMTNLKCYNSIFHLIFYNSQVNIVNDNFVYSRVYKHYILSKLHGFNYLKIDKFIIGILTKYYLLYDFSFFIKDKVYLNSIYNSSSFIEILNFKTKIIDKFFNKKMNMVYLFKRINTEDILSYVKKGIPVMKKLKRKLHTTNSLLMLDSFGKKFKYNPQMSRKKFPYYDFIFFYKLNFFHILKKYSGYKFYYKNKKKRRRTIKIIKYKYFARYINKILMKLSKLKNNLALVTHVSNKLKVLIRSPKGILTSLYNNDFLNYNYLKGNSSVSSLEDILVNKLNTPKNINLLINKLVRARGLQTKAYRTFGKNKSKKKKSNHKNVLLNRIKNTKVGLYEFYKKIRLYSHMNEKNMLYFYNHKIRLRKTNKFNQLLSFIIKFNKNIWLKTNYNYTHQYLNKYYFYQSMVIRIFSLKRRIYELIDHNWISLKRSLKSVLLKFRYKIIKKKSKFHKKFRKKQYSSDIFSISYLDFQLKNNYFNYKHIYQSFLHPLHFWLHYLLKLNYSFNNKFNTLNRFFFRRRLSLIKLSKASRYFIKLRRYKKKRVDKFDIRYLPPFWKTPWGRKNKKTNIKDNSGLFDTVEKKYKEVKAIMSKPRFKQKSLLRKPYKNYFKNKNSLKKKRLKRNLFKKFKRNLMINLKSHYKKKLNENIIDGNVLLSEYGPPFSSNKQSYVKRKKKIFYRFLIKFIVYIIKIFKNKKMNMRISDRIKKLIFNLRKNSRRKFFYKERKIKRLSYIRYYLYTMKHYYPMLYRFFKRLFRFKTRVSKNKITRNPKIFYRIKNKKLPIPLKYNHFMKFVNKYNNYKKYNNKYGRFFRKNKNKYGWSSLKRTKKKKLFKYILNDKILNFKKYLVKSIYSKHKVDLKLLKKKLLDLKIFNDNSRLLYVSREFELIITTIKTLRNIQSKLFFNRFKFLNPTAKKNYNLKIKKNKRLMNNNFHRKGRRLVNGNNNFFKKNNRNITDGRNYFIFNKKIEYNKLLKMMTSNNLKLNVSSLTNIIYLNKNNTKINLKKKKIIYICLVLLKKITDLMLNYKFHKLKNNMNSKNFNWNRVILKGKSHLYKSYFNHKSRMAMKLIRITNHQKLTLKYLKSNNNNLFYNMSFLKKFIEKIVKHFAYLFINFYNNNKLIKNTPYWVDNKNRKKYYMKMYINTLKFFNFAEHDHLFINTLNQLIKLKKKKKKKKLNKLRFMQSLFRKLKKRHKKTNHFFTKLLTRKFMKRNNKITYNNLRLLNKYKAKFKSVINASLFFFFRKNIFLRSKKNYSLRRTLKNPVLYKNLFPSDNSIINVRKIYKNNLKGSKYTNCGYKNLPNKYSVSLLNGNKVFVFNKEIISFTRYLSIIISISNKLVNNYYEKMSYFFKAKERITFYKDNYKFMHQNYLMVVKSLKNLISSILEFVINNLIINSSTYMRHHFFTTYFYISENYLTNYNYNWFRFSYFNMKYQLISRNLKNLLNFKVSNNMNKNNVFINDSNNGEPSLKRHFNNNNTVKSITNINEYLTEDTMNYLQLNYMMEYDTNNLVRSEENFLYFYNIYQYNYDYNSLFVLNPRLLCDYFIFAVKNKVQYYEIFSDVRQATGDLFRLRINLKKLYDRILYTFLHRYLDYIIDLYYLKYKFIKSEYETLLNKEYLIFLKKSKILVRLFAYVTYLVEIRNYTNIKGIHIKTGGRRSRKLRTHTRLYQRGPMSLNTFSDEIDYYFKPIISRFGTLGLKVFLYRESCHKIPLYQVMYEILFLRFKIIRNMIFNSDKDYR